MAILSDKIELATKYLVTRYDREFLPIMADRALQELKMYMRDNDLDQYTPAQETLSRYLSNNTGQWHYYNPNEGYIFGEDDVVMYEYVVTQWAVERD